jgi:riboflavin biosynthesis pyrimidine reductase
MRRLLPYPSGPVAPDGTLQTEVADVYADLYHRAQQQAGLRPYVAMSMVSSVDGAISLEGVSAGLSGPEDKHVFFYLRSIADVILVGAGTAREENYGRPRLSDGLLADRRERGQPELPRIALVSKWMRLDWKARIFTECRPYVICPPATPAAVQETAAGYGDLIVAGDTEVDLADALRQLRDAGARLIVCEGGPTLNSQLLASGLVDELCLTVSPVLVGGSGKRISGSDDLHPARGMRLLSAAEANGTLMLRYALNATE